MKSFASVLIVFAAAANARRDPDNLQGAEYVKFQCLAKEDLGQTTVRAKAFSWEADGTGDEILPNRVAKRVAVDSVRVVGKAKYMAGETFYAAIGTDCSDESSDESSNEN